MIKWISAWLLMLFTAVVSAQERHCQIVPKDSTIGFTATQNDAPVSGKFKNFSGDVYFDPAKPDQGRAQITIDTASIDTSYKAIADALRKEDWFDVKKYPKAVFKTTQIKKSDEKNFQVEGTLTLKDRNKPLNLKITQETSAENVKISGDFTLKRTEFELGKGEWASTDEVKDEVKVKFSLVCEGA